MAVVPVMPSEGSGSPWKDAHHHPLSEKWESKPQRGTTAHHLEQPSLKCWQIVNAGEGADKSEPSHTVGEM